MTEKTIEQHRAEFEEWACNHCTFKLDRDEIGEYIDPFAKFWFKQWVDNKGMPK